MNNDGERKFILVAICLGVFCVTVLYVFLFVSLWDYRQWVGLSLLAVLVAPVVVHLRGRLNEQELRQTRYNHHVETPLDAVGEPMYWQPGMQPNPHRSGAQAHYKQEVKYQ